MKPSLTWGIASACLLLLTGAMAWATWSLVGMERTRHRMEGNAVVQERTRLALWRMESVAAALVLEESARAPEQYAIPADGGAVFPADPAGRVWLHFEMDPDGRVQSPQVQEGPDKPAVPDESARRLQELRGRLAEKAKPEQWASLGLEVRLTGRNAAAANNGAWLSFANRSDTPPPSPPPPAPSKRMAAAAAAASSDERETEWKAEKDAPMRRGMESLKDGTAARQDYTPAQLPSALKPAELQRGQELSNEIEAQTRRRVFSDLNKNLTQNRAPEPEKPEGKMEPARSKSQMAQAKTSDSKPDPAASPQAVDKSKKIPAPPAPAPVVALQPTAPATPEAVSTPMETASATAAPPGTETFLRGSGRSTGKENLEAIKPASPSAPASSPVPGDREALAKATIAAAPPLLPAPAQDSQAVSPVPADEPSEVPLIAGNESVADDAIVRAVTMDAAAAGIGASRHYGTVPPSAAGVTVSDFRALWIRDALFLTRRISRGGVVSIQGAWVDWPKLRGNLLTTVADLFPVAALEPAPAVGGGGTDLLASLPLRFVPGTLELPTPRFWSPLKLSLAVAWACVFLATAAVALVLRGMMLLNDRRASFVSAVTHELRTPLATFKLYSEMLADGMVKEESKRQRYLETLTTEADRLGHLVENVLSYSRLESGKVPGGRTPVAVRDLLQRLGPRLSQRVEQAGGEWEISADSLPDDLSLTTDPSAVEQILFNLVDNACKYARRDGAAARVELDVRLAKSRVLFAVRDYGPGITRAESKKLFRPFHKSARDAAHTAPGVGLGLALCRRLARDLGGTLDPDHTWPHGACFVLRLPA
ncbi:MAG: HAMP domain-containing sensor histidine kinase [Verrucomicrobiota bacterium]